MKNCHPHLVTQLIITTGAEERGTIFVTGDITRLTNWTMGESMCLTKCSSSDMLPYPRNKFTHKIATLNVTGCCSRTRLRMLTDFRP